MNVDVALTVWGPSSEVVALRGLPVGHWWREGDAIPSGSGMVRPENGWRVESGVPPHRSLEEHIRALRALVAPYREVIAKAALANHAELSIGLQLDLRSTEVHLPADLVSSLAALGCSLDIDVSPYVPGEDDS